MEALRLTASWPVANVAAACVLPDGTAHAIGEDQYVFRLASISKTLTAWAALVAVEEGIVALDDPVGQPGCTLRHVLAHAGGYPFDGEAPIARPGSRRIYSNTGIELAAAHLADAAAMPFGDYLREAVFDALGMSATVLRGSPAHGVWSTLGDQLRWIQELRVPRSRSPPPCSSPNSVASSPVSAVSTRARGGSASRSAGRSGHTGPAVATPHARLDTSAAQVLCSGWTRG